MFTLKPKFTPSPLIFISILNSIFNIAYKFLNITIIITIKILYNNSLNSSLTLPIFINYKAITLRLFLFLL